MKTLKKNLCLVLAMVMVFGLCTVSASAKLEYADNDDITYAEAVDVLSGIGILSGSASGFRPTASITRAEAAKILAYIMIGNSEQADALKASAAPFTDVPASHWAAGYIAYCNSRGLILGVGDGSYRPNSNVTGLQFATMLLRALGYGTQNEYTGTDWSVKAASDAIRYGVFDDNLAGANATKYATREECALYAFNVIAKNRDGVNGLQKVTYSSLAGGYVANGAFGSTIGGTNVDANKKNTFANDFGLSDKPSGEDAFGREVGHHWVQKIGNSTKVITADYEDAGKQIALYTTGVTGKDLYNLIVDEFGKAVYDDWFTYGTLSIYRNSNDSVASIPAGSDVVFNKAAVVKTGTDTLAGTGNGVQTYVYAEIGLNSKLNDVRVCIIDTYMVKVNVVTKATDKREPDTTVTTLGTLNKKDTTMTISGGYATDEFAKGDYVLITVADDKIQSMEAVDVKETEVTRFNQDGSNISIVADGTTYSPAKNAVADGSKVKAGNALTKTVVDGKTHKVYVDNYGYVIAVADVDETSDYVFLARIGDTTGHSNDFDDKGVAVQVYYADGTSKVLPLKTDEENMGVSAPANPSASSYSDKAGAIYKLTMKSGKAVLLTEEAASGSTPKLATCEADSTSANKQVKTGLPSTAKCQTETSARVDNNTVFFYVKVDDSSNYYTYDKSQFKVTTYTGINSVPANKDGTGAVADKFLVTGTGSDAKIVAVLVKDALAGDVTDTVYIFTGDYRVDRNNWTVTYEAYVNGESQPLTISYKDEATKNAKVGLFETAAKKFVTLDGNSEPITTKTDAAGPAGTLIEKASYVYNKGISSLDDYELYDGTTTYSVDGMKIIDLTGNNITTLDALKEAKTTYTTNLKVAIQGTETNAITCLYVTSVTG